MDNILLILERSKLYNSLPDDTTKKAIKEFLLQEPYRSNFKVSLQRLCSCYIGLPISSVTAHDILRLREMWDCSGQIKMFTNFLLFSCKNGYITDDILNNRLNFFEHIITATNLKSDSLVYILEDRNYDRFLTSHLANQMDMPYFVPTYTFQLKEEFLCDPSKRLAIEENINHIKYDDVTVPSIKTALLLKYSDLFYEHFNNDINITSSKLINILNEIKGFDLNKYNLMRVALYNILYTLDDNGFISDKNIKKVLEVNKLLNINMSVDLMISILQSEHPEYWHFYFFKNRVGQKSVKYIDHHSKEIRDIVSNFISDYYNRTSNDLNIFCRFFEQSLGDNIVNTGTDFNFQTLLSQLRYFSNYGQSGKRLPIYVVIAFYIYLSQYIDALIFEKDGIPNQILHRQHIATELLSGFQVVKYSQFEDVPISDKWLFCYKKYDRDTYVNIRTLDFTLINNTTYRNWIKHFVWKADLSIYTKIHPLPILKSALNYLSDLKTGSIQSVFSSKNEVSTISVNDTIMYRNHVLASFDNNRTRTGYIYNLRVLLKHVERNHLGNIEHGVFYTLTHTLDQSYDNTNPIPDNELGILSSHLIESSKNDTLIGIFTSIFFLALETEFRGSQILDLSKNCLRETSKSNEYVVISETKTSANELIEQPVSSYVVREIKHCINLTEEFREKCVDTHLINKLFVIPGNKLGTYKKVTEFRFNEFLKSNCTILGLPEYTLENLRDTHMTKAEEYKIRNQLSNIEQGILSGHRSTSTDDIHYVKLDIREMLEAVHGVTIGDVHLDGRVVQDVDPRILSEENEVSNKCGYCNNTSCSMLINLDCLMCKDFVTTISRLPYFQEQIKILDQKITTTQLPHDKEDLVNIKILTLRYIEEILKLKERLEHEYN